MPSIDPDRLIVLAGEYVLGTLSPDEQREAQALLGDDVAFRREVHRWEQRFAPLALRLAPVAPAPVVWLGVQRRIEVSAPAKIKPRSARRVAAWAWLATAASVMLAIALLFEVARPPPAPQIVTQRVEVPVPSPTFVALLQLPESKMQWTVSAMPMQHELVVRAVGEPPATISDRDPELWLITQAGPVSLGVMPRSGERRRRLPSELEFAAGRVLAVSLEPLGGSPTGKPTGPVVTTSAVLRAV